MPSAQMKRVLMIVVEIDLLKAKKICYQCVREPYLREEVRSSGRRRKCTYCEHTRKSYLIGEMAERIDLVFEEHFIRTPSEPNAWESAMHRDEEIDYEWDREGEPIIDAITNAAEIPESAARDIQAILEYQFSDYEAAHSGEETEYAADSRYAERGVSDTGWQHEWQQFERTLKTEARYFNRAAERHLTEVFDGIADMKTHDGRAIVKDAGPGTEMTTVYRARVFQSNTRLEEALKRPDKHIGSPPSEAARAGRMNAHGVSLFYGATDPMVALAEVRPPVGSQVVVARFEIIRPLRLLDLTALRAVHPTGSIFDPALPGRLERATFLRSLSQRIIRPVMPDDEAFEYIATQAVADFLAIELDGIVFPSAQAGGTGLNVVVFHRAARVEPLDLPEGTEISARLGQSYEEGWEPEYSVIEEVPPEADTVIDGTSRLPVDLFMDPTAGSWDSDPRQAALRIVLDDVAVHIVQAVDFQTDRHRVTRFRWERNDSDLSNAGVDIAF